MNRRICSKYAEVVKGERDTATHRTIGVSRSKPVVALHTRTVVHVQRELPQTTTISNRKRSEAGR